VAGPRIVDDAVHDSVGPGIEVAGPRIVDDAVHDSVGGVASGYRGGAGLSFGAWQK